MSRDADRRELLELVSKLNVDKSGGKRKPHKPLLLLHAIARLVRAHVRDLPFEEVRESLAPLLLTYAPPVSSGVNPHLPYWHLQTDLLWTVIDEKGAPIAPQENLPKLPPMPDIAVLRTTHGAIPLRFSEILVGEPEVRARAVRIILDQHFEPSLHDDVLAAVGLDRGILLPAANTVADPGPAELERSRRDAGFREEVLIAYDRRCALSGFQALISGTPMGLEAAHVHWHSKGGPSTVSNGMALTPTLHKLFDLGAWTLSDDRRVLVSKHFTGSDSAIESLRPYHQRRIRETIPGSPPVEIEHIRWHREPELGGIFRWPPLT